MKHPCTKQCLKYPVCYNSERVSCNLLTSYMYYLSKKHSSQNYKVQHEFVWIDMRKNLPNLLGLKYKKSAKK